MDEKSSYMSHMPLDLDGKLIERCSQEDMNLEKRTSNPTLCHSPQYFSRKHATHENRICDIGVISLRYLIHYQLVYVLHFLSFSH